MVYNSCLPYCPFFSLSEHPVVALGTLPYIGHTHIYEVICLSVFLPVVILPFSLDWGLSNYRLQAKPGL